MSSVIERAAAVESDTAPWWKGAVIYQIYPRSFQDSNGDGVGDLPGITSRLAHAASLGVDAIWLSPFFTSPMKDFGYDIADYCNVDPVFGTLADFDTLVSRAHALGLKVIIDQVYAHTSDAHAWFRSSREGRHGPHADWYVWADPKPDGSPPSNWQSVFGGPAWTWDARRRQYYMHNFLGSQPQLNLHNPAVQDALIAAAKFWLDRGVDGFRVDAINFSMHDPELRDNPPAPPGPRTRPFDYQTKLYNQSHPDIPRFLRRLRQLLDEYGATFTVAEVGGPDPMPEMQAFTAGDIHLNSAYSFAFLYAERLSPQIVADALADWPDAPEKGWPSWALTNHDSPRALSRWAAPEHRAAFGRMAMLLLMSLRGNVFLYYGEELGLTQVEVPFEELKDPEAIDNWPLTLSRDGARTPMAWEAGAPSLGFSSAAPWMRTGPDHGALAVDRQHSDPESLLNLTRRLVALRRQEAVLKLGSLDGISAKGELLCFERRLGNRRIRLAFNFGQSVLGLDFEGTVLAAVNGATLHELPPLAGIAVEG
ncbi:MAG: alpha-amylase family glycosyl hydrolase [Sandaracinobacteroides sp.]